jgi:hypothetical protein
MGISSTGKRGGCGCGCGGDGCCNEFNPAQGIFTQWDVYVSDPRGTGICSAGTRCADIIEQTIRLIYTGNCEWYSVEEFLLRMIYNCSLGAWVVEMWMDDDGCGTPYGPGWEPVGYVGNSSGLGVCREETDDEPYTDSNFTIFETLCGGLLPSHPDYPFGVGQVTLTPVPGTWQSSGIGYNPC